MNTADYCKTDYPAWFAQFERSNTTIVYSMSEFHRKMLRDQIGASTDAELVERLATESTYRAAQKAGLEL